MANMHFEEWSKKESNMVTFFGCQESLDKFERTESVMDKIQIMWALPVVQVS